MDDSNVKVPFKIEMERTHTGHLRMVTSVTGDQEFCAYSHCLGDCGYPALFFRLYYDMSSGLEREAAECSNAPTDEQGRRYHDYKAHGSMVAAGPVWQRKPWAGERVYLPEEYRTSQVFKMWWW